MYNEKKYEQDSDYKYCYDFYEEEKYEKEEKKCHKHHPCDEWWDYWYKECHCKKHDHDCYEEDKCKEEEDKCKEKKCEKEEKKCHKHHPCYDPCY